MTEQRGIDLSSLAGNKVIDWEKVKEAGYDFAIMRAVGWDPKAGIFTDRTFRAQWDPLDATGLVRGAYLFPRLNLDVADQVAEFISDVKLVKGDLPPIVDLEGITKLGVHPAVAIERTRECVERLRDHYQVQPILYTSARVCAQELRDHPDLRHLKDCWLWLARYVNRIEDYHPPIPDAWGGVDEPRNWLIHQYAGNVRGISGMSGVVDLNRWNTVKHGQTGGQVARLQKLLGVAADGLFGRHTADAMALYQVKNGLVPTGWLSVETFAKLAWESG